MPPKGLRSSEQQRRWVPVSASAARSKVLEKQNSETKESQEKSLPDEGGCKEPDGRGSREQEVQPRQMTLLSEHASEGQNSEGVVQETASTEGMGGSNGHLTGSARFPKASTNVGTGVDVDAISVGLFESFYRERIDVQAFVALIRRFSHENESQLRRIHQKVVLLLMEDFQSLPHWPEKELLRTGELMGQLIRWNLIPDHGPLQRTLCCMLHALKEPANSLLHRFGHRVLEQFRSRLADTDVAAMLARHIVQPSLRLEDEDRWEVKQRSMRATRVPMNGAVEQQLPRTSVNQTQVVSQTLLASVPSSVPLRSQGIQAAGVTWMFGSVAKAPPRQPPRQPKQGATACAEEKRDRDARGKQNKRSSARRKNATNQDRSGQSTVWPTFIEVELDTLKFCLTDEDVEARADTSAPVPANVSDEPGATPTAAQAAAVSH
ncbi:cnot1 [Symbiodinium natans]|uniref:Cnot1 protein n=1 Tax=Symbiodinium natans TaxID=878477 RepID=A0A812U083_9DINO|nr:cnot1 [Symbiodinium natans]